jgi:hypothetical protein
MSAKKQGRKPGYTSHRRKFNEKTKNVRVPESWDVEAIAHTLEALDEMTRRWEPLLTTRHRWSFWFRLRWQPVLEFWWDLNYALNIHRNRKSDEGNG